MAATGCSETTVAAHENRNVRKAKRQMHVDSAQIEDILNPVLGVRDALRRRGIEPRNHSKNNIKAVKHMSELNALRKQVSHQRGIVPLKKNGGLNTKKADLKDASAKALSDEDLKNNYILRNIAEIGAKYQDHHDHHTQDKDEVLKKRALWINKDCYGKVPNYLQVRKMELLKEHEAKERAKEASLCPQGMRIMSNEERYEALDKVVKNKVNIEAKLHNLPLIIETPSLKKTKTSLERRLIELEEAEKIFSRPKVIVKT